MKVAIQQNRCRTTVSEKLLHLVNEYAWDRRYCVELLRFFGSHPYAWFNRLAIIQALKLGCRTSHLDRVLMDIVDKGLVRVNIENNSFLYSLNDSDSVRSLSLELAALDRLQIQLMLTQPYVMSEPKVVPPSLSWNTVVIKIRR